MGLLVGLLYEVTIARIVRVRPKFRKRAGCLEAYSDWRILVISLGGASRRLWIDPRLQAVRMLDRRFWFFIRRRRIPFDAIEGIAYGYQDVAMSWFSWEHQAQDVFTVALRMCNGEEIHLFRFFGAGEFVNDGPFPDWWYWEDQVTAELTCGNQESESRLFAETAARLIGVPIVPHISD